MIKKSLRVYSTGFFNGIIWFKVLRATNTIEFPVGSRLSDDKIGELIDKGVSVTVVAKKKA